MSKSKKITDLLVWQKSHQFVLKIYEVTRCFPKEEIYGLTSQIRRASVSIPANIAEGFVKRGTNDKIRYYNIAQGSLEEVKYCLILTHDLEFCDTKELQNYANEIGKLLNGYINRILDPNF